MFMIEKVNKVIDSCETQEQLESAKKYVDLYCEHIRNEHKKECKSHCMDCEMLEISFDMLYDKIKEKDIWKK